MKDVICDLIGAITAEGVVVLANAMLATRYKKGYTLMPDRTDVLYDSLDNSWSIVLLTRKKAGAQAVFDVTGDPDKYPALFNNTGFSQAVSGPAGLIYYFGAITI